MTTAGFEDLVSREQPALLRLAVLLAGDRGHAQDLVQTALLESYRHWGRITRSGEPTAYVRRVLVTTHQLATAVVLYRAGHAVWRRSLWTARRWSRFRP